MKATNNNLRVNGQIRASRIRLVDENGEMKGVTSLADALKAAHDVGLDLVEVSPARQKTDVPVCKLLDYGKVKYEMSKKQKHNKHGHALKEMRIGLNTAQHDLNIKHSKIADFLKNKHKVKYVMQVRGRQKQDMDSALTVFENNLQDFKEVAKWDSPQLGSSSISVTLTPSD